MDESLPLTIVDAFLLCAPARRTGNRIAHRLLRSLQHALDDARDALWRAFVLPRIAFSHAFGNTRVQASPCADIILQADHVCLDSLHVLAVAV